MKIFLLVAMLLCVMPSIEQNVMAQLPSSSIGPTSKEEAQVIWTNGKKAFQNEQWQEAVNYLTRYIDRYPAAPNFSEAHLLLGKALLFLARPKEAIKPIRYFISFNQNTIAAKRAQIDLCEAYLQMKKYHEALLTADEIIKKKLKTGLITPDLIAEALLYKAKALINLERDSNAQTSLTAAKKEIENIAPGSLTEQREYLLGQSLFVELWLKGKECGRLASKSGLSEDQVINQIERRGICLHEEALILAKALELPESTAQRMSLDSYLKDMQTFAKACKSPPARTGKLTQQQIQRYKKELSELLLPKCKAKQTEVIELFKDHSETASKIGTINFEARR